MTTWDDNKLAAWARNWHWNDCAEDRPVDPSIYFRDMRMLKAFLAAAHEKPEPLYDPRQAQGYPSKDEPAITRPNHNTGSDDAN